MSAEIVDIFKNKQTIDPNQPFDWQGYVDNVRTVQEGFHTLDAHMKGVAFHTLADIFVEILESIFKEKEKTE